MRPDSAFAGRIGGHIEKIISLSPQDVEAAKRLTKKQLAYILYKVVTQYLREQPLRANLCKILISSFARKIDFAHNFSVNFFK